MRLKNKVALITGAAHGIGKTTALTFAHEGAHLALWDLDKEAGPELARNVEKDGGQARFYSVDVSQSSQVLKAVEEVVADFGKIDVLINNAGILRDSTLLKMEESQWDAVINVNLKGVYNCTQAVARAMVEHGGGKIINAASVVALYGNFGQTNYVASKAGVIGMTKTWARELGRKGICVNAVAPGFIATEMIKTIPEKILERVRENTPLGRLGEPQDVANVYLFLASDEANFINGAVISVDGGIII
ncbi:MAG: 3-oxoacyl-[acyl-carrier-protein] reductase [bacterium]